MRKTNKKRPIEINFNPLEATLQPVKGSHIEITLQPKRGKTHRGSARS